MRHKKVSGKWWAGACLVTLAAGVTVMMVTRDPEPAASAVTLPPTPTTTTDPAAASPDGTGTEAADVAAAPAGTPARAILVDGWSAASLGDRTWSSLDAAGVVTDIGHRAATNDDITTILARSPLAIRQLVARTITSDPSLTCTEAGCQTSSGAVDLGALTSPATATTPMGTVFAGWNIGGVLIAEASESAVSFKVSAFGDVLLDTDDTAAGAGFGRIFPLFASWLDGGPRDIIRSPLADTVSITQPNLGALWAGPGVSTPAASVLTVQQLTAWSSPTTGCHIGVLCTPVLVRGAAHTPTQTATFARCDSLSPITEGARGAQVILAGYTSTITAVLPAAIHQVGVYGDASLTGGLGTPPALVEGTIALPVAAVDMYDQLGMVTVAGFQGELRVAEDAGVWDEARIAEFVGAARFVACPGDVVAATIIATPQAPAPTTTPAPVATPEAVVDDPDSPPTPKAVGPVVPVVVVDDPSTAIIPGLADPGTPYDVPGPGEMPAVTDPPG